MKNKLLFLTASCKKILTSTHRPKKIIKGNGNTVQIGDSNTSSNNSEVKELIYLKDKIQDLNKLLESKEEIITLLKQQQNK